ncbi:RecX family transcriptional regulator [Halosquirtibacter laminarini]|uniref:RecX family transcriptional regulator n=1 Tax=Halosquirtibacter laminarini TaxID=3374600 RepID=A0AC61NFH1_9BACT|nr:RecX family transcriptional regulator [Prolixibacteraceae bacterium]
MKTYTKEQALNRAAALCSRTEKCSFDIQKKLIQWGIEETDANEIIDRLIVEKFLDDERFVRYYVKDKMTFNGWGKQKIWFHLQQKRMPQSTFETVWEEMDKESYNEKLISLLQKKQKSLKTDDPWEIKQKLMRYAAGRGFQIDEIYRALDAVEDDDEELGAL